jgi:hypothetical protein
MLFYKFQDAIDFATAKTAAALQSHRGEPELGYLIIALNMDMFGFVAITGVEIAPIRSNSQDGWHRVYRYSRLQTLASGTVGVNGT